MSKDDKTTKSIINKALGPQLDKLFDYIKKYPTLTDPETGINTSDAWKFVHDELNALPGAVKSTVEWHQVKKK